jgi:type IV secretory pathway VirB10-like protein
MDETEPIETEETEEPEGQRYEDAEKSTELANPPVFDRKKVTWILLCAFVAVVLFGFIFNMIKTNRKKNTGADAQGAAVRTAPDFLRSARDRSLEAGAETGAGADGTAGEGTASGAPEPLPAVYLTDSPAAEIARGGASQQQPPPGYSSVPPQGSSSVPPPPPRTGGSGGGGGGGSSVNPLLAAMRSPLVPRVIEGSLFRGQGAAQTAQAGYSQGSQGSVTGNSLAEQYPYLPAGQGQAAANEYLRMLNAQVPERASAASPYASASPYETQNAQENKQGFYGGAGTGFNGSGRFLPENAVWTGTIIPGVLETAINTDLPGNVIARVTENVYDSRTGKHLLIPQGSLLVARYNSSVSYAQKRVQIAWDTLIRPDGYEVPLGGMNAVDRMGMSGMDAVYHENWFEYLKAAGIITMFTVASSYASAEAERNASQNTAQGIAEANAGFVGEVGGNIVSRALNIQPTLTVASGERISIMVGAPIFLPPLPAYAPRGPYILE